MHACHGAERRDGGGEGADGCAGARRAATPTIKAQHQQLLFVMDMDEDARFTGERKEANTAAESTPPAAAARSDRHISAWKDDDFICSAEDLAAARGSWTEQVTALLRLVYSCCARAPWARPAAAGGADLCPPGPWCSTRSLCWWRAPREATQAGRTSSTSGASILWDNLP